MLWKSLLTFQSNSKENKSKIKPMELQKTERPLKSKGKRDPSLRQKNTLQKDRSLHAAPQIKG